MSKIEETLEEIIDLIGVDQTLHHISAICAKKAEHIKVNWQDNGLEKLWLARADKICQLANEM